MYGVLFYLNFLSPFDLRGISLLKKYAVRENSFLYKEKLWSRMMLRIILYGPVYRTLKKKYL